MALFPTNAAQVQAFAGALYGVQVGSTTMTQVNSDITAAGGLSNALNAYYTASFGNVATATVAASLVANIGISAANAEAATAYVAGVLNGTAANARGAAIMNILNLLSSLTADATFGAEAAAWNAKVETAVAYTGTSNVTMGSTVSTGSTFTLTAGSLDGVVYTGTAGTDSLTATVTNADDDGAAVTMSGIENMTVRVSGAGGVELLMGDASGIETFTANRLGSTLTLTDAADLATDLVIANQSTTAILDVNYEASVVAGAADEVNLTVNRTTDAEADLDGVEVVNLTSTNAPADAANVLDLSGAGMETVNVTADADLTLAVDDAAEVNVSGAADVTVTLAAGTDSTVTSTGTGALTVNANGAADLTLTGSTGDDTFSMGATLTADDVIDGGEGADTLVVDNAGAALVAIPADAQITGVETLRIEATDDSAVDAFSLDASIVKFETITIDVSDENDTYAITEYTDETINIVESANNAIDLIDVSFADATGAADTLTLNVTNNDDTTAFTVDDIASTGGGVETVTLVLNQGADIADASDILVDDVSIAADTLTIAGDADATIGGGVAITIADIDASAATGDLVFELGAATTDITTGSGDDTIDFNAALTSADSADGGEGDDTLLATVAASQLTQATISNVETIHLDFANAGSTFSARNVTGMTALTLEGAATNRITNLAAEVATVNLIEETDDEVVTIAYATGSDAAHTLNFTEVTAGGTETYDTVTVSGNAGAFSVTNDADFEVTSITNNAATSLTITTAALLDLDNAGIALSATAAADVTITTDGGDFDVSDAAGTVDVQEAERIALNALDGSIIITDELLADGTDVAVTLTADGDDANDITIGLLTATNLSTLTATATGGSDITLSDIVYSGDDAAGDDTVVTMNLSADGAGSTVTVSDLSVAATVVLDSVVITTSDDGVVSFTSTDTDAIITSIDASAAAADDLVIDVSSLAEATEITLGAGTSTVTTSDQGDTINVGSGEATLNLTDGATEVNMSGGDATINQLGGTAVLNLAAGVETIKIAAADATEINGFDVENDIFVLDNSLLEAIDGTNLVDGNSANIVTSGVGRSAIVIDDVTSGADYTMDTASSVLRLSGAFADTAAVDAELVAHLQDSQFADADDIVVIWSDGANAHISLVALDDIEDGANAGAEVFAVTVNDLAVLVGLAHTDITAASLGDFFAA